MTAKKKKKGGGIFWKLLFLVALCVFCFSMYQLVNIYLGYKKGVDEYHAVAEATTVQSSEPLEVVEEKKDEEGNLIPEEELTVNPPEVDFDALKAINDPPHPYRNDRFSHRNCDSQFLPPEGKNDNNP